LSLKCTIFEILAFDKYLDLENWVRGYSRSTEITPIDRSHMTSYSRTILTLVLASIVSEIQRDIAAHLQFSPTPPLFHASCVEHLLNFWTTSGMLKLQSLKNPWTNVWRKRVVFAI